MPEVVAMGESMLLLSAREPGPLRYAATYNRTMGGAEANVCIGLSRLGHDAAWFSILGNDEAGIYIRNSLRGEGVDVNCVKWSDSAPTALYLKERAPNGDPRVFYYRKGSACSSMQPEDVPEEIIRSARLLHVTGITPALSNSCRNAVFRAIEIAREASVLVSFDPNMRYKLWPAEAARPVLMDMARMADIVLPGASEGEMMLRETDPERIALGFMNLGARVVAVKLGDRGALVSWDGGTALVAAHKVTPVDSIGAGDAFAAAFIAYYLEGLTPVECTRRACISGALATLSYGDWEGLPSRTQIESILIGGQNVSR